MKRSQRNGMLAVGFGIIVVVGGVLLYRQTMQKREAAREKQAVSAVVTEFGRRIRLVSLAAPSSTIIQAVRENYGSLISPGLFEGWTKSPDRAPGQMNSYVQPDRIEILSIDKQSDGAYEVQGSVIEVGSGNVSPTPTTPLLAPNIDRLPETSIARGVVDTYQVALKLRQQPGGAWLITGFTKALPHAE